MRNKWRRYEVLIPRRFNDGQDVPVETISKTVLEIADHFGAVSHETQVIEGHWREGGIVYRDDLTRIVVDFADIKKNREWMRSFKARWKKELDQLEIWMVSYRIEVE